MKLINYTTPAVIIADENKKIREKNDIYKESYVDERGNKIEEHNPYYATLIFVPNTFTEEDMNNLYVEE